MTEQGIRENFFRTRDATTMLAERTALVDDLVRQRWAWMPSGIALAAVGGYGRRELFPHSDVDLLIVTPDEKTQAAIKEPLSMCLRDLWDKGLRISQSVHTPADCNQINPSNAELAVSLLDRRYLAGDESLFRQIRDPRPELGRSIAQLTRERHARFQDTIYHLEPNVKDSPGGLRDLQVLRWLAQLGAGDSETPGGVEALFEIRCFLHYLGGRDDNKLSFERQDELATLSGAHSPEELMRRYYRAVRGIARLANRRLDRFEAKRSSLFSQFRDRTSRLSNTDFSILHGEVFFRSPSSITADPLIFLRLFEFLARHGLPLAADTDERLERSIDTFDFWVSGHQPIWPAFREILRQPHAGNALRAMHGCGALEVIFPELREMEALVIRDFYHRYTVDEHTLVAIQNVLDLRGKKDDLFGDLAAETDEMDLLVTALLFHDVGKGTPDEGHVEVSRRIADSALRRVGISERERSIVGFLIGSHLELSAAMNGRDLSDPATARDMAAKTGTVEQLKLLTLLTYADISAVHPSAMTPWRRQLLWNLYSQTYTELTRELSARMAPGVTANPDLLRFLEGLPPRYLRTHGEKEMEEHLRMEREGGWRGVTVSLTRSTAWVLTVVASDRPFLFASIAAAISSFGFNILKAEAFSNARGTAIDTFTFADPARTLELNPSETDDVTRTVARAIRGEISVEQLLKRRPKVKPDAHAVAASRVNFDNQASPSATLFEMVAQDRPGLLYDVASVISKRGGNIEVVLVDTEAKKAIDVFYVTKAGAKLGDQEAGEMATAIAAITNPPA
ncbi:MAG TPA: HD domain-containing protein [Bryobacteraceae bacterium]|nr:HD domain-containing protein [Bryobacteraceae bacterium]